MTEDLYDKIWEEARRRAIAWQQRYMCQDINARHDISYWVAEVTEEFTKNGIGE